MNNSQDGSSESLKVEIVKAIREIDESSKESILRNIQTLESFISNEEGKLVDILIDIKREIKKIFESHKSFGVISLLESLSLEPENYEIKGDLNNKVESSEKLAELANNFEKKVNDLKFEYIRHNLEFFDSMSQEILEFDSSH